jgi:hypothetical protein
MTSRIPSQCKACRRFGPITGTCEAFPGGIPGDILFHGEDHRQEFPGDRGIRFQQGETLDQLEAFQDWQSTFGEQ